MYHIYTSPSLILRREPSGDSAYFRLMTRDFGMVIGRAQGIRRDTSRLKGILQEYSLATVAYVRTKAGWKITTAIAEENFFAEATKEQKVVMARISDCLIRFIPGEESSPDIFAIVQAGFRTLIHEDRTRNIQSAQSVHDTHGIELLILVRILSVLGYIAPTDAIAELFHNMTDFSAAQISIALQQKKLLVAAINKAFKESHL